MLLVVCRVAGVIVGMTHGPAEGISSTPGSCRSLEKLPLLEVTSTFSDSGGKGALVRFGKLDCALMVGRNAVNGFIVPGQRCLATICPAAAELRVVRDAQNTILHQPLLHLVEEDIPWPEMAPATIAPHRCQIVERTIDDDARGAAVLTREIGK
jgi:hypothetical protein